MKTVVVLAVLIMFAPFAYADWTDVNSLLNPGFETGDLLGWTVNGTSPDYGVALDGTPIFGVHPVFAPAVVIAHSGDYAIWANVAATGSDGVNPNTLIVSQSIYLPDAATALMGFHLGNGGSATFGTNVGFSDPDRPLSGIFILVNGQPILIRALGASQHSNITPDEYVLIEGQGNLTQGWNNISFQITGSGTFLVGVSADDFFANVPESSSLILLATGLTVILTVKFR